MRELIGVDLGALTVDGVREALQQAGDEDDLWEAKGGDVRSEHIQRAVAGLANRDGGLVILGAERRDGCWALVGLAAREEPGTWISHCLTRNLRPLPPVETRVLRLDARRWAAVLRVQPHPEHLVVLRDGAVVRREAGQTPAVDDGAVLSSLVAGKAVHPTLAALDASADAPELADAVARRVADGAGSSIRPVLAGLRREALRAAEHRPIEELGGRLDAAAAVTGALVAGGAEVSLVDSGLRLHHALFDEALELRVLPGARPDLDLQREVRRSARAVGALLMRLELWSMVRMLAEHRGPELGGHRRGWISTIAANEAPEFRSVRPGGRAP